MKIFQTNGWLNRGKREFYGRMVHDNEEEESDSSRSNRDDGPEVRPIIVESSLV